MAEEIGMDELEKMCSPKTPAYELEMLIREATTKEFIENFFDDDIDEEEIMMIRALNLTTRTLRQIHDRDVEIELLKTKINEIQAKIEVLEIERRFEHNKDGG